MNWDPYLFIKDNNTVKFWGNLLEKKEKTIYLMAKGFDPRMNSFVKRMSSHLSDSVKFCALDIEGDKGPYKELTQNNWDELCDILSNKKIVPISEDLKMWDYYQSSKRRVGPFKAKQLIESKLIEGFKNIVIDISSMPRAIYFSLITAILNYSRKQNQQGNKINVFINIVENPELDKAISSSGVDDSAEFIPQLTGSFNLESDSMSLESGGEKKPKVWMPILGENQKNKLEKIYEAVTPNEINPVLPFPTKNPRRTDDLLLSYRELLFDNWIVEHENLIYASESNPFQLYRLLFKSIARYFDAFKPLGGCKVAISSLSSKLLSIGALLVSYDMYRICELDVGLIHVGGSQYTFDDQFQKKYSPENENFNTLWVDGEPYE